jgi:uncharacterized protein (TIGR02145 family)
MLNQACLADYAYIALVVSSKISPMKKLMNLKALPLFILVAVSFFTLNSCKDKDEEIVNFTLSDIDGNQYKVLKIGNQVWMTEDLRVTHYANGDEIERVKGTNAYEVVNDPHYYFVFDDDDQNSQIFGNLYTWGTVSDSRKIAPAGWHVPSHEEWIELQKHLGMSDQQVSLVCDDQNDLGGALKDASTSYWNSPNSGASNSSGLSLKGGGFRSYKNTGFVNYKKVGAYWSSTSFDSQEAWYRHLYNDRSSLCSRTGNKKYGFAIRCVKD